MRKLVGLALVLGIVAVACTPSAPTALPVATAIPIVAVASTETPLPTKTAARAETPTSTATATPTETAVPTKTFTPTATASPTATATLTRTPLPTATNTPASATSVVFVNDFESTCPFPKVDDDNHISVCEQGEYVMVNKKGGYVWRQAYRDSYEDGVISVEGRAPTGDAGIAYGVAFRISANSEYYLFTVSPAGSYRLDRYSPTAKWTTLIPNTPSTAVKGGAEKNRLQVIMQGPQLALYVNDQFLDTVTDSTIPSGKVALAISSDNDNGKVTFDNVVFSKINRPLTLPPGKEKPPTPTPMPTLPAGMGGLIVFNWMGNEMNYSIGGKIYKVPGNGNTIIVLPPGTYTFSFDAPGGIKANCSTAEGCKVTIEAGKYQTQSWSLQR